MQGEIITGVISAASALDTIGVLTQGQFSSSRRIRFYARFSAGTSVGAVKIESSSDPAFTGEWTAEATIPWSVVNKETSALVEGPFIALRARISTAVVGGTVSVHAVTQR